METQKEILAILNNPKYGDKIQFLIGSIFREKVLSVAKVYESKVFIMANQFAENYEKDDTFAILASKTINQFDNSNKIYVQMVGTHYLMESWADWKKAMSTQALKMGEITINKFY